MTQPPLETVTPPPMAIFPVWDHLLAASSLACFIFGTPGNILSLIYFSHQRKDLPTKIYILMTITDMISCMLVLPVGLSFLNEREAGVFGVSWFCDVWSTVWYITPYFSVFLVLVLSVVRTISLLNPFRTVSHKVVLATVTVYLVYLTTRVIVPQALKLSFSSFDQDFSQHIYCAIHVYDVGAFFHYIITSNAFQLTAPVIPIIVSCVISCYCVMKSRQANALSRKTTKAMTPKTSVTHQVSDTGSEAYSETSQTSWKRKLLSSASKLSMQSYSFSRYNRNVSTVSTVSTLSTKSAGKDKQLAATITILLITAMYIAFNIPVFIYYVYFVVEFYLIPYQDYAFLTSNHVNYYGWNVVFVQCVALNAALNPAVYAWRIQKMRTFFAWHRVCAWTSHCWTSLLVYMGLRDKCHLGRRSHGSFSTATKMVYVTEVIHEEPV